MEESIRFYEEVMDFKLDRKFSPHTGTTIAFLSSEGECKIELIDRGEPTDNTNCHISIGFSVDDMEKVFSHLKSHNTEIVFEPQTMPNGVKLMQAKDPNGVLLGFAQEAQV